MLKRCLFQLPCQMHPVELLIAQEGRKNWSIIILGLSAVVGWFMMQLPSRWLSGAVRKVDKPTGPLARSEARKPAHQLLLAGHCLRLWQLQLSELGCKSFTSLSGQTGSSKAGASSPDLSCWGRLWSSRLGSKLCSHPSPISLECCSLQKTFNSWKPNQGLGMPRIQLLWLRAQLLHLGTEDPSLSLCAGLLLGVPAFTLAVLSPAQACLLWP